jgi:hypothetical protein
MNRYRYFRTRVAYGRAFDYASLARPHPLERKAEIMRTSWIAAIAVLALVSQPVVAQQANNVGLRIVVVDGEDAVNIIQQKTAVAPIVEVRDRNNLPVSGATVTFSIGPGASFGGQSTLTVLTNAAGQATATGLTPTAAGAIQIQATATFQGQTAIATIAQSNVMTAAEVATTTTAGAGGTGGGTGGGSTAAAGGGGGAGGGLSGATLGIIGGAAAGGAVVATKAAGGGDDSPSPTSTTPPPGTTATTPTTTTPTTPTAPTPPPSQQPTSASYQGPISGTFTGTSTVTFPGEPAFNCTFSLRNTGNATLRTQTASTGSITGTLEMNGTQTPDVTNCTGGIQYPLPPQPFVWSGNVEGSGSTVRFTQEFRDSGNVPGAGSYTTIATVTFTGNISGGAVTGTLQWTSTADIRIDGGGTSRATWTGSINLSLR